MSLTENQKHRIDNEVERLRDITQYIRETTNVKDELLFDMANVIYLKTAIVDEIWFNSYINRTR